MIVELRGGPFDGQTVQQEEPLPVEICIRKPLPPSIYGQIDIAVIRDKTYIYRQNGTLHVYNYMRCY